MPYNHGDDVRPEAYAQWVIVLLRNIGTTDITLKNLKVDHGKLHEAGDKDREIPPSRYEGAVIKPSEALQLNACGRENAAQGTTGQFDLVDENGARIRHFKWDCPWSKKRNVWEISDVNDKFVVESWGANLDSGALGTITVTVLNNPNFR